MMKPIATFAVLLALTACNTSVAVYDHVSPESLLDVSSERVSFKVVGSESIDELSDWVNNDQPTRAEVNCSGDASVCSEIELVLNQFAVPFEHKQGQGEDQVVLVYDRIFTRDCEGSSSALGCSIAANTVQMVVDNRQFLDPALLDLPDAEKAVSVFDKYMEGRKARPHGPQVSW